MINNNPTEHARAEKAKKLCNDFFADYMVFGEEIALEQLVTVLAGKPRDVEKYLDPNYDPKKEVK